jgi:hypothetical protein
MGIIRQGPIISPRGEIGPYEGILIPTDGGERKKAAIIHGLYLTKLTSAEVIALFVSTDNIYASKVRGPSFPASPGPYSTREEGRRFRSELRGRKDEVKVATKIE